MWNDRSDAKLLKLKREGYSFAEVAERMGITRNAALGRFQRLNGRLFPSQLERRRSREAAARLKSETRLQKEGAIIRKMNAAIAAGTDKARAIKQARAAGASYVAIGNVFGVSRARVYQIVNGR